MEPIFMCFSLSLSSWLPSGPRAPWLASGDWEMAPVLEGVGLSAIFEGNLGGKDFPPPSLVNTDTYLILPNSHPHIP